jgi:hypothetical protein
LLQQIISLAGRPADAVSVAGLNTDQHRPSRVQKEKLISAKKAVEQLILSKHCNPIVVRLAWHDSGSYDKVRRPAGSSGRLELRCVALLPICLLANVVASFQC